ncbi:MAG: hypothetical protein JNL39_08325 [Opitutaceae bacterium]|nr:hypothetical protein [Opitutaceae bacterium]
MTRAVSTYIQFCIVLIPTVLFVLAKRRIPFVRARLALATILAVTSGAVAYYFAEEHGWRPFSRYGKVIESSPTVLFGMNAGALLIMLGVLTFIKEKDANEPRL